MILAPPLYATWPASARSSQLTDQAEDTVEYKLDMSMMFAMHDALRRELVQVARIAGQRDGNPATRLHAALGWELFKKFLTSTTSPKTTGCR